MLGSPARSPFYTNANSVSQTDAVRIRVYVLQTPLARLVGKPQGAVAPQPTDIIKCLTEPDIRPH